MTIRRAHELAPRLVLDAVHVGAGELLARRPGIVALHTVALDRLLRDRQTRGESFPNVIRIIVATNALYGGPANPMLQIQVSFSDRMACREGSL